MGLVEEKNDNIQDLVIPGIEKERFRINGDNSKILELATTDMNVLTRLNEAYPKLLDYANEVAELGDVDGEDTEEQLSNISKKLDKIDSAMREQLDYIFDTNISEVCAGNSNLYDPKNGKFLWEHIIEAVGDLYKVSFNEEFEKMKQRVEKHTEKYVKKSPTKTTKAKNRK